MRQGVVTAGTDRRPPCRTGRSAQHLTKQLTDVQHELDRVSVAEQVVTQMLAEPEPAGQDMPVEAPSTATRTV
ncbi:hypothetical protein [Streptosporangium amethystogenes]|uniref:hypothetical protein n=1 Tax=Streptosporangium amethystogenes TaxID=2002 RepID=UPI0012FAFCBE|nr:hypothetical protein [Streptosporangium amethystogenes]